MSELITLHKFLISVFGEPTALTSLPVLDTLPDGGVRPAVVPSDFPVEVEALVLLDIDETIGDSTEAWWFFWSMILLSFCAKLKVDIADQLPSLTQMRAAGGTHIYRSLLSGSGIAGVSMSEEQFDLWQEYFMGQAGINAHVAPLVTIQRLRSLFGSALYGFLTTRPATSESFGSTREWLLSYGGGDLHLIMRDPSRSTSQTAEFKIEELRSLQQDSGLPVILVDDNDGMMSVIRNYNLEHQNDWDYVPIILIVYPGVRTNLRGVREDPSAGIFLGEEWESMERVLQSVSAMIRRWNQYGSRAYGHGQPIAHSSD